MSGSILACRPVDLARLAAVVPTEHAPTDANLPIYTNSVQGECELCGEPIWIGPRIGIAKQVDPSAQIVCLICVITGRLGFIPSAIRSLGNTDTVQGGSNG